MVMTVEDIDFLTRVGPGTPMNSYLRSHWIPAVRSAAVQARGAPVRIQLLGEKYVAFRNGEGKLGFQDEACPHRGVSLALGRNEEGGLRCIYHGWQFDVSGRCVDVPNEVDGKKVAVAKAIKVRHFPTAEKGGLIWVYLGSGNAPAFPNFEWLRDEVSFPPRGAILHCNWLQTMEGNLDPDHVGQLHSSWFGDLAKQAFSVRPSYEVVERPWGFAGAASRNFGEIVYHRVKEMALPWYAHVPFNADEPRACLVSIPIDDERTYVWYLGAGKFNMGGTDSPSSERLTGQPPGTDRWQYLVDTRLNEAPDDDNFRRTVPHDPEALWDQNRAKMAQGHFSGLPGFVMEDFAVFESMGKIQDRTKEHLVGSDRFIAHLRRALIAAVRDFAVTGTREDVDYSQVSAIAGMLTPDQNWRDLPKPAIEAVDVSAQHAAEPDADEASGADSNPADSWDMVLDTPMGEQPLGLTARIDGRAMMGTIAAEGDSAPIIDGVVNGASLKWRAQVQKPMPMVIAFDVTVAGDTLTGTFKAGPFPARSVIGKRRAVSAGA